MELSAGTFEEQLRAALSTSHYKAPLQLPSMTMLAGITIHWSITTSPSVILVPCITMSVLSEEQRRRLEKRTTK